MARVLTMLLMAFGAVACGGSGARETPSPAPSRMVVASASPEVAATSTSVTVASPSTAATAAPDVEGEPAPSAKPRSSPAATPAATAPPAAPPTTGATLPTPAPEPSAPIRASRAQPKGVVLLSAKLGAVSFDHGLHAGERKIACTACHHPSRPEKPLSAENQGCRECHTTPASAPMKTGLQAAFHDPKAATGTCIGCHKQTVAKGKAAPLKCTECHKRK
jgi:hypothetical protein